MNRSIRLSEMIAALLFATLLLILGTYCNAGPCGCTRLKELPARYENECEIDYYKRIFPVDTSCGCKEKLNEFYEIVFYKYLGESEEQYISRVDVIFDHVYPEADCRTDIQHSDYLKEYYACKYVKKNKENDEAYFKRVLKKSSECASVYKSKIELMKRHVKSVDWSKVVIEENTSEGYSVLKKVNGEKRGRKKDQKDDCGCVIKQQNQSGKIVNKNKNDEVHNKNDEVHNKNVKEIEARKKEHKENIEEIQEKKIAHQRNVDNIEASKRKHEENVASIEVREREHENNVNEINARKKDHEINVQKIEAYNKAHEANENSIEERKREHDANVKQIDEQKRQHEENVRKWIKENYKRKSDECVDDYYKRICCKDSITDEEYVERLTIARSLFRDLDLWYNEKYLNEIEYYYKLVYTRKISETDVEYCNRLLSKEEYESEEIFLNRVRLLSKLFPHLSLWYDERLYEIYTHKLYRYWYQQGENERDEIYVQRVFTCLPHESEENFWMRIKLIKKTFPHYSCWYNKENIKSFEFCECLQQAENIQDLKNKIYSENISDECREIKLECLKPFFESSESSCSCGEKIIVARY